LLLGPGSQYLITHASVFGFVLPNLQSLIATGENAHAKVAAVVRISEYRLVDQHFLFQARNLVFYMQLAPLQFRNL
jgi:hypothetical protein